MTLRIPNLSILKKGDDCTKQFKQIYENRYTWGTDFPGYMGNIEYYNGQTNKASFVVDNKLNFKVEGVSSEYIKKVISSQLWELTIHRVKRNFLSVHGENSFTVADVNEYGTEVLVGGKNEGDRYSIKDGYISMVYRNIHGKIINIITKSILDTGQGYLSTSYTSKYLDKSEKEDDNNEGNINYIDDKFIPLYSKGPWVLEKRMVRKGSSIESFTFTEMQPFKQDLAFS